MPSIEISKLQAVTGAKPLSGTDRAVSGDTGSVRTATPGAKAPGASGVSLEIDATVSGAKPPVDADRVAEIREALRDGSYPLVPTKIADAMIAAQFSFEVEE
jgi:negative regulator of flagellin synthesis FlgM